jgi:hypothetical protein
VADSIPVDKLALMLGVDSNAMIAGFTSAAASSRAMARALMEAMNREFEKGNEQTAKQFETLLQSMGPMQNAHVEQYRKFMAQMGTMYKQEQDDLAENANRRQKLLLDQAEEEKRINNQRTADLRAAIQNRATLERSASNVMIAGMGSVGRVNPVAAAMSQSFSKFKEERMAEFVNEQNALRIVVNTLTRAELDNIRATAEQNKEIETRSRNLRESIIASYAAIDATHKEEAAVRSLSVAKRLQAKIDEDAARIRAVEQQRITESIQENERQKQAAREAAEAARLTQQQQLESSRAAIVAATAADDQERAIRRLSVARRLQAKVEEDYARINAAHQQRITESIQQNEQQRQQAREAAAAAVEARDAELERARIAIVNANAADEQERAARRLSVARRLQAKADEDAARILAVENRRIEENNALNEEAARILRMIQTPEEAHKARVEQLNTLFAIGKINQDQYNRAVKQSQQVMQASAAGMGKMTGVLAQLSFGIEDFAQGIAMGDLRSALLGASNNMSMVVRGLVDMREGTTIAGMAVGKFVGIVAGGLAAAGALAYYLNWLSQAKRDTRSLTDAIRDATMGFDLLGTASKNQMRIERERMSINRITSIEEISRREQEHMLDQIANEKELMRIRNESSVKAAEIITNMMGGAEARVDAELYLQNLIGSKNADLAKQATEMQKALFDAQRAMAEGNAETTIREMRKVFEFLNDEAIKSLFNAENAAHRPLAFLFDRTALNALEEYFEANMFLAGESEEKLRQLREEALKTKKDLTEAEAEQNRLKAQAIDMELRRRELEAERLRNLEQEFFLSQKQAEAQQKEVLFLITATDHQKELLRLKKESAAFGGAPEANVPGAIGFGGIAGGMVGMMADMAINMAAEDRRVQFLEAQRQQLQAELNKLMQQEVKPQGALEQNAFQAQADAFKQIIENANKQPNPQVTRIINLITSIDAALKNGGVIKVVP